MYFYQKNGKQMLDMRGDLVLTHNTALIKARVKSSGPCKARNAEYILINTLSVFRKIRATFIAIGFIWGKSTELTTETIKQDGL